MQTYTKEVLEKVQEYSGLFLLPEQITRLLDLNLEQFKSDIRKIDHPLKIAYEKGKFTTVLELRKHEIELAKMGSAMALELIGGFIIDQKQGER